MSYSPSVVFPQIRYSPEHRSLSLELRRPLYTLDIWYPGEARSTTTGVLTEEEAEGLIRNIRSAVKQPREVLV